MYLAEYSRNVHKFTRDFQDVLTLLDRVDNYSNLVMGLWTQHMPLICILDLSVADLNI